MNNTLTSNELKKKGISAVSHLAKEGLETIVTVRGKEQYVILSVEEFNRLRECELTAALIESEQDIERGRYHEDSVDDHIKRVTNA